MNKFLRNSLRYGLLGLLLFTVPGCLKGQAPPKVGKAVPKVRVIVPRWGTGRLTVTCPGKVVGTKRAAVDAPVSGIVRRVGVKIGDRVSADQPILWLDSTALEARLLEQQASLDAAQGKVASQSSSRDAMVARVKAAQQQADEALRQAKISTRQSRTELAAAQLDLKSKNSLFKEQAIAYKQVQQSELQLKRQQAQVETARSKEAAARFDLQAALARKAEVTQADAELRTSMSSLDQARAALETTRGNLRATVVRSPIAGVVISRDIEPGQLANPGKDGLIGVVAESDLRIVANLDQRYLALIKIGSLADVTSDLVGTASHRCRCVEILPDSDPKTDLIHVTLQPMRDLRLQPRGLRVQVHFLRVQVRFPLAQQGWLMPALAVHGKADQRQVRVVQEDGRVATLNVTELFRSIDPTVVTSGIKGTERIIVDSPDDLKDGQTVEIEAPAAP